MTVALSIIIPTYAPRKEFQELLLALVKQETKYVFEIIVVDDGNHGCHRSYIEESVDRARLERRDIGVYITRLGKNSGPAQARNEGVQLSKGEVFLFIDSDCFIHSKTLVERAFDLSQEKTNTILGGTVDGYGIGYIAFSDHFCHWVTNPPGHEGPAPESHLVSSNMVITRQVWRQVGSFNPSLRSGEDVDYCFRSVDLGISLWLSDTLRIGHYDRTRLRDYFYNYFVCGSYRPLFYGQFHKGKRFLTSGPRWARFLLIPVISAGLTLRYLYRWISYDPRVFLAIIGILIASFAMALGCAVGRPKRVEGRQD